MREAVLVLAVILIFVFVSSLDFSNTGMGGIRGLKISDNIYGEFKGSESKNALADLRKFTDFPKVPLFYVEGLDDEHFRLRTAVSTKYENGVWIDDRTFSDETKKAIFGKSYKVTPIVELDFVPVTKDTVVVTIEASFNESGDVFKGSVNRSYYGIMGRVEERPEHTRILMSSAELEEIRKLAESVAGSGSDYEKLKRIETFLRENYEYSHEYTPGSEDPVYRFLFVEKKGVCKHFASAFVVMAESIGIPARAVFGYLALPTERNQTVFSDQAHMWAEAFVDGKWIEFDPTPSNGKKIETKTLITHVDEEVVSGGVMRIEGVVEAEKPVNGYVEVYIGKEKRPEILLGVLAVKNGSFSGSLRVPEVRGEYDVLAHFTGSFAFAESWSDPKIRIYEVPELKVEAPKFVPRSYVFEGSISVPYAEIFVYVDGSLAKKVKADENGVFNVSLNLSEGEHVVSFYYPGGEFVKEAKKDLKVYVGEFTIESEVGEVGREGINLTVYFGKKAFSGSLTVNGVELKAENGRVFVPIKFEKAGYYYLNVSVAGYETVVRVKVMDRIRVELVGDKIHVYDSYSDYNGTIIVNGERVVVKNGYAKVKSENEYEIVFEGDEFHYPARFTLKRSLPLYYLLVAALPLIILLRKPEFGIEFVKEHPDLPNVWKSGEEIVFVAKNCEVFLDNSRVMSPVVFETPGKYTLTAVKKRLFRTFKEEHELTIVSDYGEAVVKMLEDLESTLRRRGYDTKSMTAREIAKVIGVESERFIRVFEDFRYGKRRGYRRDDFVTVWSSLRGVGA